MVSSAAPDPEFSEMALLTRGFQLARMIQVAAALGLADLLVDGPQTVADLARRAGAHPDMLLRLCRALAAFGIFEVDAQGTVSQSRRSACLYRDAVPTLHYAARYWGSPHVWGGWANLEHTVRTGESAFEAVYHQPKFEYLKAHPDEAALFDLFMQHSPDDRQAAVAEAYDFSGAGLVADIGGGTGALLAAILRRHAGVRGLLFDQEAVVAGAVRTLGDVAQRVQIQAGDFFQTVPAGADIYTLSLILHDWDDQHALDLLRLLRAATLPGTRLLVIEKVLDSGDGVNHPASFLSDINMMVNLRGRERTLAEFAALLARSGFGPPRLYRTRSPFCILETLSI